jgi:hypothetical protein
VELYPNSLNTPSWRGVQLKRRDNSTFIGNDIMSTKFLGRIWPLLLYLRKLLTHSTSLDFSCFRMPESRKEEEEGE